MTEPRSPAPPAAPAPAAGADRVTVIAMAVVAFLGAACLVWATSLTAG